jgi:hypothetical protein
MPLLLSFFSQTQAEVNLLMDFAGIPVPVEVKSGVAGRLPSMRYIDV